MPKIENFPKVAVLIAARNEAEYLACCLHALVVQSYPPEWFEVWVGDDQSVDETALIASDFAKKHTNFHLVSIQPSSHPNLKAKANVLAQLVNQSTESEWLLITDADTQVPPRWIETMVSNIPDTVGMRTGFTLPIAESSLFLDLQTLDWLAVLSLNHWFTQKKYPLAAMGNNMLVRRLAYDSVGGYKNIPFSLTEDFALFHALQKGGWEYHSLKTVDALAQTRPEPSWLSLLNQRQRWIRGALQVGGTNVGLGILICLQLLILLFGLVYFPKLALVAYLCYHMAICIFLYREKAGLRIQGSALALFLYPLYGIFAYFSFFVSLLVQPSIRWRGRKH